MRSLSTKLTLAFLLVGLTGAVLVALILRQQTQNAFDRFILNREQQVLATSLIRYYQNNGNWSGMGDLLGELQDAQAISPGDLRPAPRLDALRAGGRRPPGGLQPAGRPGRQAHLHRELGRGVALQVDGDTAGWLLPPPAPREWIANSPEELFLQNYQPGHAGQRPGRCPTGPGVGRLPGVQHDPLAA